VPLLGDRTIAVRGGPNFTPTSKNSPTQGQCRPPPDGPVVKPVLAQLEAPRVTSANKALGRRRGPNADVGSMQADRMHVALAFPTAVRWCQKKHAGCSGLGSALLPCGTGCCSAESFTPHGWKRHEGSSVARAKPHELCKEMKPTHKAWWLQCWSCAVSAIHWTVILVASQWLPCVHEHEQVSDSCTGGSDHLIRRPTRERRLRSVSNGFARDEHSSSCR